jgi:hypothetical protein
LSNFKKDPSTDVLRYHNQLVVVSAWFREFFTRQKMKKLIFISVPILL